VIIGGRIRIRSRYDTKKSSRRLHPTAIFPITAAVKQTFSDPLSRCECCPRRCGVNRPAGQTGFCKVGGEILLAHAGLHYGEEPPISGTRGSGTVFFAGCNLRCVFCQNWQISQEFKINPPRPLGTPPKEGNVNGRGGRNEVTDRVGCKTLTATELADKMLRLQSEGAHNINFVSPSHMIFQMADAIQAARGKGLTVPVVYNSNGYDSVAALRQIRGLVDIYLPDIKYMDNALGRKFSAADDYADVIPGVLREMLDQVGLLELDDAGVAKRGLLVRHLVLPGQPENSKACLKFLAELSSEISVSIMSQYSPQYKARGIPELNRSLTAEEYDEITDYALEIGLENAFIQTLESQETYLPDFNQASPFFD
jgi:putative pyruvate formate lyase activating enzyme